MDRQMDGQVGRQAGGQAGWWAGREVGRQAGRQAERWAGRRVGRWAEGWEDGQMDKQTDRWTKYGWQKTSCAVLISEIVYCTHVYCAFERPLTYQHFRVIKPMMSQSLASLHDVN